jgi:hypothetical protein
LRRRSRVAVSIRRGLRAALDVERELSAQEQIKVIYGTALSVELSLRKQDAEQDVDIAECLRARVGNTVRIVSSDHRRGGTPPTAAHRLRNVPHHRAVNLNELGGGRRRPGSCAKFWEETP